MDIDKQLSSKITKGLVAIPKAIAFLTEALTLARDEELRQFEGVAKALNQAVCSFWDIMRKVRSELSAFCKVLHTGRGLGMDRAHLTACGHIQEARLQMSRLPKEADDIWRIYSSLFECIEEAFCEDDVLVKELEFKLCHLQQEDHFIVLNLKKCRRFTDDTVVTTNFSSFALWDEVGIILRSVSNLISLENMYRVIETKHTTECDIGSVLDNIVKSNVIFRSLVDNLVGNDVCLQGNAEALRHDRPGSSEDQSANDISFRKSEAYGEVVSQCSKGLHICDKILKSVRDEEFLSYKSEAVVNRITEAMHAVKNYHADVAKSTSDIAERLQRNCAYDRQCGVSRSIEKQTSIILQTKQTTRLDDHDTTIIIEKLFSERKRNICSQLKLKNDLGELRQRRASLGKSLGIAQQILVLTDDIKHQFRDVQLIIDALPIMEIPPPVPPKRNQKIGTLVSSIQADQVTSHVNPTRDICDAVGDIIEDHILGRLMFAWMKFWMFSENFSIEPELFGKGHTQLYGLASLKTECISVQKAIVCGMEDARRQFSIPNTLGEYASPVRRKSVMRKERNQCSMVFDSDYDMKKLNNRARFSIDLK